ncbi:MAG TPA: hypothetical protein VMF52_01860 [Steroidobacteraceae bacterium]|nr:hypothetical protein [Steroidobacteraceae bacterium]
MKSLDRQALEDQTRLVSRYVAGDLSRSERAEFEAWLIASPELAAEVEMERRMRRGIASAARRGWLKRPATTRTVTRERSVRVAIAASLLAAVAVGWSMFMPATNAVVAEARTPVRRAPLLASRTVHIGASRGIDDSADITVSHADAPGELVIEPDVVALTCEDGRMEFECPGGLAPSKPQYPEYEADLVDRSRATLIWRSPRQTPVSGNQLSFAVQDPGALRTGDYDFIVRGHSPDHEEVVARFTLQITR